LEKKRSHRKRIRYFRWSVKVAFLLIFVLPIIHLAGAPSLPVYSYFYGGVSTPLFTLPYGQSVCALWILDWGNLDPGAWLACPVGGLQAVLTRSAPPGLSLLPNLLATIIAVLVFLIPIFILGNVFCGWICPLGTMIDCFDKGVERFMPELNTKREERRQRNKEKEKASHSFVCPTCPFGRLLGSKHATVANGVLVFSIVGSAIFRIPVFCAICPIGICHRGMFHLKTLTSVTGTMMPIIIELWAIPAVTIILSLREKRYWCRKLCPVGATLNLAGSFSPLIKPTVKADQCVMKGCPENCKDYSLDYCFICRQTDQKKCERVCPQDINLLDKGSLAKCTKCLECYIQCEHDAIEIKPFGTPDALTSLRRLKARLKPAKKNS
jgi:polyferredoxin